MTKDQMKLQSPKNAMKCEAPFKKKKKKRGDPSK